MFYRLMGRLTHIHIPANVGDFRLMSRRVVDQVKTLREKDRFVRGLVELGRLQADRRRLPSRCPVRGRNEIPFSKMLKLMWTTVPPAKSIGVESHCETCPPQPRNPPPHTMCASGK